MTSMERGSARSIGRVLGVVALGLGLGVCWAIPSQAERLPVYKLSTPAVDRGQADRLLTSMHKGKLPANPEQADRADALAQRVGKKEVEISKVSGGIFARDVERLWNPTLKPKLPSQKEARTIADAFLAKNNLLPKKDPRVKVSFVGHTETIGVADSPGTPAKVVLDRQVNYQASLNVKRGGKDVSLPIVGGAGKYKVAVGERGEIIGLHGLWRPIETVASEEEILPQKEAERRFQERLKDVKLSKVESFLAYYGAPAFEEQTHLAPVWVVKAQTVIDGKTVPLRNTIVAATKYGPELPVVPAAPRVKDQKPLPKSIDEDEPAKRSHWLDSVIKPAWASPAFEAGTSWIGPSQGLAGSPANAKGFVDGLAAAGWTINFNWGEAAAFESDWNRNDDSWVDAADFVFYTGHANENGWVLNKPDDTFLNYTEVGATPNSPSDHYGQNDLEWIIIAACGPHESSHFTTGVGNAFDRWRGIFDGLHVFMGYGAVTYDNTTEGSRVVQLARAGWPIIDAWFRTAWEIQPSTNGYAAPYGDKIYVTAMYAHMGDHATRNDHIWGNGITVADPVGAGQQRYFMWSGT